MFTAVATTIAALFQVKFGKYQQALLVDVIVFALFQWWLAHTPV